jgi:diguanylate cyclase (GGDEF)-like protein
MRLRPLFLLLSVLLSLCVIAMAIHVAGGAWRQLAQAQAGLQAMQQLRALLIAAEMASRERGPANGVLGAERPGTPDLQERLRLARHRTDTAFDALGQALDGTAASGTEIRQAVRRSREHLQQARQTVDAIARKERGARGPDEIRAAVERMIGVVDALAAPAARLTNDAAASFPLATDALIAARQAAALREYAGQLGSQFTAPLSSRQRLSDGERVAIDRLQGRIDQLRLALTAGTAAAQQRPAVSAAVERMQARYFGSALPYVEAVAEIGLRGGHYPVDAAGFAARYVPDMDAIITLRDVLLGEAVADARRGLERARRNGLWTAAGALLALALLATTLYLLDRRVVRPLTRTTALIVTIARGQLDVEVPAPQHRDEVADMLAAIEVLRDNSIARHRAEEAIRQMAYYDRLTGLPNRRLLEDRLQQVLASAQRKGSRVAVLFIDLDRFKPVNDQHGHEAGDWLLQQVAERMLGVLRASDTAARIGGDEFIVLLPEAAGPDDAVPVAERIRQRLEQPFTMDKGLTLQISSSIGVAFYPDHADNPKDLLHFGDEAMYLAKKRGRNAVEVFAARTEPGPAA